MDGSIDVRAALRRLVESGRAAAMQRTIGEYAHRMHYGFDGGIAPPGERDGDKDGDKGGVDGCPRPISPPASTVCT